jgi:hypothetical protein
MMNTVMVGRNGHYVNYGLDDFWSLCRSNQLLRSDHIFDYASGRFLRADQFANLAPFLPAKGIGETVGEIIAGALGVGTIVVLGAGAALCLESLFVTSEPATNRKRKPNYEPLEGWRKEFVRERDGEICAYCGCHAPWGHVDHKTSRANGGSNLFRNLVWACSSCNCSKGRRNAPHFRKLIWTS